MLHGCSVSPRPGPLDHHPGCLRRVPPGPPGSEQSVYSGAAQSPNQGVESPLPHPSAPYSSKHTSIPLRVDAGCPHAPHCLPSPAGPPSCPLLLRTQPVGSAPRSPILTASWGQRDAHTERVCTLSRLTLAHTHTSPLPPGPGHVAPPAHGCSAEAGWTGEAAGPAPSLLCSPSLLPERKGAPATGARAGDRVTGLLGLPWQGAREPWEWGEGWDHGVL